MSLSVQHSNARCHNNDRRPASCVLVYSGSTDSYRGQKSLLRSIIGACVDHGQERTRKGGAPQLSPYVCAGQRLSHSLECFPVLNVYVARGQLRCAAAAAVSAVMQFELRAAGGETTSMTVNSPVSWARRRSPKPSTSASDAAFVEGVGSPRARSVDIPRTISAPPGKSLGKWCPSLFLK